MIDKVRLTNPFSDCMKLVCWGCERGEPVRLPAYNRASWVHYNDLNGGHTQRCNADGIRKFVDSGSKKAAAFRSVENIRRQMYAMSDEHDRTLEKLRNARIKIRELQQRCETGYEV